MALEWLASRLHVDMLRAGRENPVSSRASTDRASGYTMHVAATLAEP